MKKVKKKVALHVQQKNIVFHWNTRITNKKFYFQIKSVFGTQYQKTIHVFIKKLFNFGWLICCICGCIIGITAKCEKSSNSQLIKSLAFSFQHFHYFLLFSCHFLANSFLFLTEKEVLSETRRSLVRLINIKQCNTEKRTWSKSRKEGLSIHL